MKENEINQYIKNLKIPNNMKYIIDNLYIYNKILEKFILKDDVRSDYVFKTLLEQFKKNNALQIFFEGISISVLRKYKQNLITDKEIKNILINLFSNIFIEIYYDCYTNEIDYIEDLYLKIFKNINEDFLINNEETSKKLLKLFLNYTLIEYSKDKSIGYTRINFNKLFENEFKLKLYKFFLRIYISLTEQEKLEILEYLILLNDYIYINEIILSELLLKVNKLNLEIYIMTNTEEYINFLYEPTIYLLSITSLTEVNKNIGNITKNRHLFFKNLNIYFLKKGIILKELLNKQVSEEQEKNLENLKFFEEIILTKLIKNGFILLYNDMNNKIKEFLKNYNDLMYKIINNELIKSENIKNLILQNNEKYFYLLKNKLLKEIKKTKEMVINEI